MRTITLRIGIACWMAVCLGSPAQAAPAPEDELAGIFKMLVAKNASNEWFAVERISGSRWAALPPKSLQNCLPDGACFARQGTLALGGRNLVLIATGARSFVTHIYLRNAGAAFGESGVLAALQKAGIATELARCPVRGTAGDTNWYRLKAASVEAAYLLSTRLDCTAKARICWARCARRDWTLN